MSNRKPLTLGSLFDGIGAFPYAASFFGIKTVWASEILPNAISVTKRHFPEMEHLGDITKLDGKKIPPVEILTLGSPCQSWSLAGDRSGFSGQSNLIMEAIRIIKEMRYATNGRKPEIVCIENVPGLLSSKSSGGYAGSDYKTVLEAFCEAEIPMPESGRWANAGMVRGRGIDLAWVTKDSQFYHTAQRRKRLFVILDFTGQRAGEILFVSKSLSGYFAARKSEGEETTGHTARGAGGTGEGVIAADVPATVPKKSAFSIGSLHSRGMLSANPYAGIYEATTSRTLDRNCNNPACNQGGLVIVEPLIASQHDTQVSGDIPPSYTMRLREGKPGGGKGPLLQFERSGTLATGNDQYLFCPICRPPSTAYVQSVAAIDCRNLNESPVSGTLQSKCTGGYSLNYINPIRIGYIVRRLTPTEAERLMSLPDAWTECGHDGKRISDSARYSMCGNSIVVNVLAYIMQNIAEVLA